MAFGIPHRHRARRGSDGATEAWFALVMLAVLVALVAGECCNP